jgi:hypothetical protein
VRRLTGVGFIGHGASFGRQISWQDTRDGLRPLSVPRLRPLSNPSGRARRPVGARPPSCPWPPACLPVSLPFGPLGPVVFLSPALASGRRGTRTSNQRLQKSSVECKATAAASVSRTCLDPGTARRSPPERCRERSQGRRNHMRPRPSQRPGDRKLLSNRLSISGAALRIAVSWKA